VVPPMNIRKYALVGTSTFLTATLRGSVQAPSIEASGCARAASEVALLDPVVPRTVRRLSVVVAPA
jgi:hypothetical protein